MVMRLCSILTGAFANVCRRSLWVLALLWVTVGASLAQSPPQIAANAIIGDDPNRPIAGWRASIETIRKATQRGQGSALGFDRLRNELEEIATKARLHRVKLLPRLTAAEMELAKIGTPRKGIADNEQAWMRKERQRLDARSAGLNEAVRVAEVIVLQTEQLITQIERVRRALFRKRLFERNANPLLPTLWRDAGEALATAGPNLVNLVSGWWRRAAPRGSLFVLLALTFALWLALSFAARWLIRPKRAPSYGAQSGSTEDAGIPAAEPAFFRRTASAIWVFCYRAAPPFIVATVFYSGLAHLDLLPQSIDIIVRSFLRGLVIFLLVRALAKTVLAVNRPAWRLLNISDESANRLYRLTVAIAAVFGLELLFSGIGEALYLPISVTIVSNLIFSIVFAILLFRLLSVRSGEAPHAGQFNESAGTRRSSSWWSVPVKLVIGVLGAIIVGAAFSGFISLARFLTDQVVVTGSILVVAILVHLAIREFCNNLADTDAPASRWLAARVELSSGQRRFGALLLSVGLNLLLALAVVPLILLRWGFSWQSLKGGLQQALFRLQIGSIDLSLVTIAAAVGLFILGVILTRMFQRLLDGVLQKSQHVDRGLNHSIRTGVGYVGFALSTLLAVSFAGFDFTNLAIVAGALSVGIGFGLQSIVNNFLSGLILLVERPVQVGDWIIVGESEGYVRRISVRSTELETFDRSSIIIPNSELVTGRVINWTHRNSLGRVLVNVGVGYSSDPDLVRETLLAIGRAHPLTLDNPAPSVVFGDFGDSSLDFSLRVYIEDINYVMVVQTDLRTEILKTFRAVGIEIPFPQQDIHLRDLDGVKASIARALSERTTIKDPQ